MQRSWALCATAAAIGGIAAALAWIAADSVQSRLADAAARRQAAAAASELAERLERIELAGALYAGALKSKADPDPDFEAMRALLTAANASAARPAPRFFSARSIAAARFALGRPGAPASALHAIATAEGVAGAALAESFARLHDGKALLRAARRADPNGAFSALANGAAAAETALGAFWLVWPLADRAEAVAIAVEIRALSDAVVAHEVGPPVRLVDATPPPDGASRRLSAFGDKAASVTVRTAGPAFAAWWTNAAAAAGVFLMTASALFLGLPRLARPDEDSAARQDAISRDIADKQRELEASEARFRHLAESTNVTPWTADLDAQRFTYVGPQIEDLTGFPTSQWTVPGFWADHIHPADRRRVLYEEIPRIPLDHYHTIEYRVRAADGMVLSVRNMLTVVRTVQEHNGRSVARTQAQGFLLDVTELKRAADALDLAREKAEEANRVKSEFLANMSHELRTPLNAVIGFSEIMKDELFGPLDPQYREYAASIHASGRHLLDLINDVLDLSKIEAGRFEIAAEETDLAALLHECKVLLQERMQSAGLHGRYEIPDDLPPMELDERRVKQVVLNLLSNAIKFTPPGGSVTLRAGRREDGGVSISVIDTGIGMSADEIPRALAKFGQIDGELSRAHDGTGLGLPIAKSLIEMHEGRLEITSEKGKGTEMRIWLPASRVAAAA